MISTRIHVMQLRQLDELATAENATRAELLREGVALVLHKRGLPSWKQRLLNGAIADHLADGDVDHPGRRQAELPDLGPDPFGPHEGACPDCAKGWADCSCYPLAADG